LLDQSKKSRLLRRNASEIAEFGLEPKLQFPYRFHIEKTEASDLPGTGLFELKSAEN
jgi:hypothetical protein